MNIKIESTIKKINDLIENTDRELKPNEVMQLSQSALNLAHVAATLNSMPNAEFNGSKDKT